MKLPAKIIYACKAVFELAAKYNGETPVQVGAIAAAQGIPKRFLTQLLLRLKNGHIVNSSRGITGGYFLARHPSLISLAEVVRAIDEGFIDSPRGIGAGRRTDSERLLLTIWNEINDTAVKRLQEMNFEELVSRAGKGQFTYCI